MGGLGSGGRRISAGRLRIPVRSFCQFCCRPFVAYKRGRVFCDLHQLRRFRRGDPTRAAIGQALVELERFKRQFAGHAAIAAAGAHAVATIQALMPSRADVCTDGERE